MFGTTIENHLEDLKLDKAITDLRVDSVYHTPGRNTAANAPRMTAGTKMCKPIFDLLNKPETVEVDLARMT